MNTVFVKSQRWQDVPSQYSDGLQFGPIHDKTHCGFTHTLNRLLCRPHDPGDIVESFTTLAIAVYAADKGFSRSSTIDAWTREFRLSVPSHSQLVGAVPFIEEALTFLSGDVWKIDCRDEQVSIGARTYYRDGFVADAVCLFSGGTDSLAGAINLLEDGRSVMLVSHFDSGADARIQKDIALRLASEYGTEHVRHLSIQVCAPVSKESSTRARSFLFIALGLMLASAYGEAVPVYIPENGFVAINTPLTGTRQGSFSTRTTHSSYMTLLRKALVTASVNHEIVNPLSSLSKGEVLLSCRNLPFLRRLLPLTVSCAKAGWVRWEGETPGKNCGFCYPCLVRRAALHALIMDRPDDYVTDAIGSPHTLKSQGRGADLRSILQFISRMNGSKRPVFFELLKSGSLSGIESISEATDPVEAGLAELTALVLDKGCPEVRQYAMLP